MAQRAEVWKYPEPSLTIGGETQYEAAGNRIVEVRRSGLFNASVNLLWHFTQDPDKPRLPPVYERGSRGEAVENAVCVLEDEAAYNSRSTAAVHIGITIRVLRANWG